MIRARVVKLTIGKTRKIKLTFNMKLQYFSGKIHASTFLPNPFDLKHNFIVHFIEALHF